MLKMKKKTAQKTGRYQLLTRNLSILSFLSGCNSATVEEMCNYLKGKGFKTSKRTVQRDLQFMKKYLPLENTELEGNKLNWFLRK